MAPISASYAMPPPPPDSCEEPIPDVFQLLFAEIFPLPEGVTVESAEILEADSAAPSNGVLLKKAFRSPAPLPTDEGSDASWLTLCSITGPIDCQPKPKLGLSSPAIIDKPTSAGQAQLTANLMSATSTEGSVLSVQNAAALLREPEPPVVLDGWMRDSQAPIHELPSDATSAAQPESEGDTKFENTAEVGFEELIAELPTTNSGGTQSDSQGADAHPEQELLSALGVNRSSSVAADPTWTNSQILSMAPRWNGSERYSTEGSNLSPRTPLNPRNDPSFEAPANSPRTLTVRIQDTPGSPVDLRFVESKGAVKVTVRAEDNQLARAIADELPRFERRLESKGWSSEFHAPNQVREAKHVEEIALGSRERAEPTVSLPGMDGGLNEQSSSRQHRTQWEEEIEDRTIAAALRRLSISKELS